MIQQLSPEEIVRREALDKLRSLGIDPFPAAEFETDSSAKEIIEFYLHLEIFRRILCNWF
jgi:lysyl-tRNA synthetase class 2